MLDDDDVGFVAAAWPSGGGVIGCLIFVLVLLMLCAVVAANEENCALQQCERGTSELHDGQCICVEKPKGTP